MVSFFERESARMELRCPANSIYYLLSLKEKHHNSCPLPLHMYDILADAVPLCYWAES